MQDCMHSLMHTDIMWMTRFCHLESPGTKAEADSASRFVLFTSSVEPSLQPLSEAWAQLGEEQSGEPVLHGLVDTAEDPHLADRFKITGVPTFLLFRDRKVIERSSQSLSSKEGCNMRDGGMWLAVAHVQLKFPAMQMYKYSGVDTGADALTHFSREGYKSTEPLLVPPEPSPIEAALDALRSNSKLVRTQLTYSCAKLLHLPRHACRHLRLAALDGWVCMLEQAIAGATLAFLAVTLALLLRQGEPAIDKAKKEKTTKEVKAQ